MTIGTPQELVTSKPHEPSDTTAREAALERTRLVEMWKAEEVAKMELNLLNNLARRGLGVP